MQSAQTNFGLLDVKDRDFEKDLLKWFKSMEEEKRTPGVFLVAVKEGQEGERGSISVLHHVIVLEEGLSPDIVGLDSFNATLSFKGVKSADLFGRLTPHKGARKAGASDYFVPSVDGLTEGAHPTTGRFVPGAKDVCANIQSLEFKNNGVFVPYPLAQLLLGEEVDILEDDSAEEEEPVEPERSFNPRNPMDLLHRLVKVMSYKKKHQPEWYREWKAIAQEAVGLLWSVGNGFATGIEVTPVGMNRQLLEHQVKCSLELFKSDKELYGDDEEEGGAEEVKNNEDDPSIGEATGAATSERERISYSPFPTERTVGEELNSNRSAKQSPFLKGSPSPSPSPRKDRQQGSSFRVSPPT